MLFTHNWAQTCIENVYGTVHSIAAHVHINLKPFVRTICVENEVKKKEWKKKAGEKEFYQSIEIALVGLAILDKKHEFSTGKSEALYVYHL